MSGRWVDGTFGAGGIQRAFLDAGAAQVFALIAIPKCLNGPKTGLANTVIVWRW